MILFGSGGIWVPSHRIGWVGQWLGKVGVWCLQTLLGDRKLSPLPWHLHGKEKVGTADSGLVSLLDKATPYHSQFL